MAWLLILTALATSVAAQNPFTLDEIVTGQFAQRGFSGTWISDTEFTFVVPGEPGINVFNANTLTSSVLVSPELLDTLNTTNPILSADGQYILARTDVQQVYRYSFTARYSLYNIATQQATPVADNSRLQLCIFGGGHSLAYVLDNDVYYLPENSAQAIRLTNDGVPDVVYNGHTDWVYEEDVMYTGRATWFSTDGSYLAFASFNDTEVETYSYYYFVDNLDDEDGLYPKLVDLKYPKVGRTNPTVSLRVVDLNALVTSGSLELVTLEAPPAVTADHILGGVTWPTDNEIAAQWLNRRQNYAVLNICNIVTGDCESVIQQQPNGWVPIALPRFSTNGDFFMSLGWSEQTTDFNYWQHLYMTIRDNGTIDSKSITPGAFTVDNFVGMDEENNYYYYTRTTTNEQWRRHVYVTGAREACISCGIVLPGGGPCTWASATLSRQGSYMSVTCSSPSEPSATYIFNPTTNTNLYTWETNSIVRERLAGKDLPQSIIDTVPLGTASGRAAPFRLHLPPGLNVSDTDTKYPLIFYVYSGPNTNNVYDTFTVGYHSYLTTSRNMIYLVADGRGAGLNGQDNLYAVNNALGTVEIFDHSVILKQVLERYQFIDPTRVGIWGHSYGGYATLLTLVHDEENLFRCGVSSAPVTSWLYYNSMYTERYMGLPTPEDNLSGYEASDVTLLVEKLRGKDFYVIHGNADDNVHYQNAAMLLKALQERDIPFEQMSYPDEDHSLSGVSYHRYMTMDNYWDRCLDL